MAAVVLTRRISSGVLVSQCRISSGVLVSQSVKKAKSMERVGKTEPRHGGIRPRQQSCSHIASVVVYRCPNLSVSENGQKHGASRQDRTPSWRE